MLQVFAWNSGGLKEGSHQLYWGVKQVFEEAAPQLRDSTLRSLPEQRQRNKERLRYLVRNREVREGDEGSDPLKTP